MSCRSQYSKSYQNKSHIQTIKTEPCPLRSDASAIVLLKPVICLGHPVIRNKNNKAGEQKEEIRTFYTDVSSILFTYNENDLFSSRGRKEDREKEKKRNGLSALWEKKFKMPWTIHRWDG